MDVLQRGGLRGVPVCDRGRRSSLPTQPIHGFVVPWPFTSSEVTAVPKLLIHGRTNVPMSPRHCCWDRDWFFSGTIPAGPPIPQKVLAAFPSDPGTGLLSFSEGSSRIKPGLGWG